MKPRIAALALLVGLLLPVGLMPTAAQMETPVVPQSMLVDHYGTRWEFSKLPVPNPSVPNSPRTTDPYEPNNDPAQATPLVYGDELTDAIIQVSGDNDWYKFEGQTEDVIEIVIDAESLGSYLYPHLHFYRKVGSDLELVAEGNYGSDTDFNHVLEADGEYFLQIQASNHGIDGGDEYYYDIALYLSQPWQSNYYAPEADTYVSQAAKTANYGSAPILRAKDAAADMNIYLKYAVDPLDASPGQCISQTDSSLGMFVKEPSIDGGAIYAVSSAWDENTITWNNAPPIEGEVLGSFDTVSDEHYRWAALNHTPSTGLNSFAIRTASSDSVDYSSAEGESTPWLYIAYRTDVPRKPLTEWYADLIGLAPLTAEFLVWDYGCPTSWFWDFGDGNTSTERNPTHTFTEPGTYYVQLTVSNSHGSRTRGWWAQASQPPNLFYISPATNAIIGGISAQSADILLYDKVANTWTMAYDGSAHNTPKNIASFAFEDDGDLLLVFAANQAIPGLGIATPHDIVKFTPDSPLVFPLGAGSWAWQLRGSWPGVGLTTKSEAIDALDEQWANLSVSTSGVAVLPTDPILKAADEDVIYWADWASAWDSAPAIDGSEVPGLSAEDVNGYWSDPETSDSYITILGSFNLDGVIGDGRSIVRLEWDLVNGWQASLVQWLAPGAVFPSTIDAIELGR